MTRNYYCIYFRYMKTLINIKADKEVNYTVMTEDEFAFRKKRRDPFIEGILLQPQVVLAGDEEEINKWG